QVLPPTSASLEASDDSAHELRRLDEICDERGIGHAAVEELLPQMSWYRGIELRHHIAIVDVEAHVVFRAALDDAILGIVIGAVEDAGLVEIFEQSDLKTTFDRHSGQHFT